MTFADKLIRLRKRNGMSQEDLADKLGVSRQAISKWEGMLSVPDLQNVLKISELFNVTTDYLLKDGIVEENAGAAVAAGVAERDGKARARAVADFPVDEEEEEFFEIGRYDTGADAVVEEKKTDVRLFCVAGVLILISAILSLVSIISSAAAGAKLDFVNFLDLIFSCVAGIVLICSIKREKIAAISFALLLAVSLISSFNYFISAFRYPQYFVHFIVKLCDVAFYVMAIITLFFKKPLKKVVCAMAVMPSVGAVLNGIYYIATVEWSGRFIVFYPYSAYFISMILMAVAMAGSNVKKRSGNENIGLAGLTLIVMGYAMTLSFLIVSTAFPFENLLTLRNLTVIYMALSSVINVIGYVLLPWLICYESKKPVKGVSAKKGYFNIAAHILLTGVTAYIWHWVWVYRTSDTVRGYKGGGGLPAWVQLILYVFVPFYHIYWFYKHGRDISEQEKLIGRADKKLDAVTVVFAVLTPFVASVVLQDRLNAVAIAKSESIEETDLEAAVI